MLDFAQRSPGLTTWLARHRQYPQGTIGALVGRLTAFSNGRLIRIALDRLDIEASDHILEVGCGTGRAIAQLLDRVHHGFITGIDHSALMARLAIRRNIEAIDFGRLEVRQATVSRLPYLDGWFTKAFAIDSFSYWPKPDHDVAEVRRVLKPGGRMVVVFRSRGHRRLELRACQAMERAGLVDLVVERHGADSLAPVSVVGLVPNQIAAVQRVI